MKASVQSVSALWLWTICMAVPCLAGYEDPCLFQKEIVVRDFYQWLSTTKAMSDALVSSFNDGSYNTTGVRALPVAFPSEEWSSAWQAYTNAHGVYDVLTVVLSSSFHSARPYLMNVSDIWSEFGLETKLTALTKSMSRNADDTHYDVVPHAVDSYGIWYNVLITGPLGITMSADMTWEQLLAACDTAMGAGVVSACFSLSDYAPGSIFQYLDLINVRLHGPEFHQSLLAGDEAFNDPRFLESLATLSALIDDGYLMLTPDNSLAGVSAFLGGNALFTLGGTVLTTVAEAAGAGALVPALDRVPFPAMTAGVAPAEPVLFLFYGIPQNTRYEEEARSFLRFMYSEPILNLFFTSLSLLPTPGLFNVTDSLRQAAVQNIRDASSVFPISSTAISNPVISYQYAYFVEYYYLGSVSAENYTAEMNLLEATRQEQLFAIALPPVADIEGGVFSDPVTLHLTTGTPGAVVYYTTDESQPFEGSLTFPASGLTLALPGVHTIRAVAIRDGLKKSPFYDDSFTILAPPSSSSDGISTTMLGIILGASAFCVFCVLIPIVVIVVRRRRHMMFSIGGDAPLMVEYEDLEMIKPIGMGAFGEVFLGRWRGSDVAVKQMIAQHLTPNMLASFVSEASVVMHLRHRNIVTFMGICTDPVCMITEFMHNGSLYDVLQNDAISLDPSILYFWAREIASGMEFLHSAKPPVLHRDFKSLNVLLDASWVPKIADFGLSSMRELGDKATADGAGSLSRVSSSTTLRTRNSAASVQDMAARANEDAQGSLYWTAPEVVEDAANYTAASDVYSYGITLWEMFSREELYGGANPFAVANMVLRENHRPDLDELDDAAEPIRPLMLAAWSQDPDRRPSFSEIVRQINDGNWFSQDRLVMPETATEPQGRVITLFIHLPQVEAALIHIPDAYAEALIAMHRIIEDTMSSGFIWKATPDMVSVAFANVRRFLEATSRLLEATRQHEWPADIFATPYGQPIINAVGSCVLRGVRFTAAAEISEPRIDRETSSFLPVYRGSDVDAARSVALGDALAGQIAMGPNLADEISDMLGRHALATHETLADSWISVSNEDDSWVLGEPVQLVHDVSLDLGISSLVVTPRGSPQTSPRVGLGRTRSHVVEGGRANPSSRRNRQRSAVFGDGGRRRSHSNASEQQESSSSVLSSASASALGLHEPQPVLSVLSPASLSLCSQEEQEEEEETSRGRARRSKSGSAYRSRSGRRMSTQTRTYTRTDSNSSDLSSSLHDSDAPVHASRGSRRSASRASRDSRATRKVPSAHSMKAAYRGIRWLFTHEEMEELWPSLERLCVGSYCEAMRGVFHGQEVLLKRLLRQVVPMREQILFGADIAKVMRLDHPSLLPVLGACLEAKRRAIIVPFEPRGSLTDFLEIPTTGALETAKKKKKKKQKAEAQARDAVIRDRITKQVVAGLAFLHESDLVFGALKPNNIILGREYEAYISDYGMDRQKNLGTLTQTATATYEAPECLQGHPADTISDVYTLGTLLYEIYSPTPYPRGRNAMETAFKILGGFTPDIDPAVPDHIAQLIRDCWDERNRRPTLKQIVRRLDRH